MRKFRKLNYFLKKLTKTHSNIFIFIVLALVACFWLSFVDKNETGSDKFEVSSPGSLSESDFFVDFLDVGKADCILIYDKSSLVIIDAGLVNSSLSVINYLKDEVFKKSNIKNIDLMVLTHPHSDHYGKMSNILDVFDVSRFITSKSHVDKVDHPGYYKLLEKLKRKKIEIEYPKPETNFKVGKMKITVLGPIRESENINDNSLVLKIDLNGVKIIFMGDAEKGEEKDLIKSKQNLKADVIKLGHHGSSTSSSSSFLKSVNPKYAVVSAGNQKNKESNYPHSEVAARLDSFGIKYFVTKDMGTIRFIVSKDGQLNVPDSNSSSKKRAA